MTDLAPASIAAPSEYVATDSALAPATSNLLAPNFDQADRNFRRVKAIEASWTLPALPDMVRHDLITADGADEDSLTELLLGLDDDFNQRREQAPEQPQFTPQPQSFNTGLDQARIVLAAATSNPAPREVSGDAVKTFKLRAIERGLLDMDPRRVDNSWSPEFNRIRGEMAYDDYNAQLRGDRPGAMPLSGAMKLLNDFTSPAGLLSLATDLDLFWDFEAIGGEMSSWGDKWRKLGESHNPIEWAGNFIDAVTGPIDDIVFPILNVGLLFVGVGAVANAARVGWQGTRLIEGASVFSRLWQGGRMGRFAEAVGGMASGNLRELGRASMIAERLRKGAIGVERGADAWQGLGALTRAGARTGDALAAWRSLRPVVASKQVVQQGMRLGFAEALESRFPGYESDGASLGDIGPIGEAGDWLYQAGLGPAFMPLELMFAPYNIWSPGTFFRKGGTIGTGLISESGRGLVGALGSAPGRAVAGGVAGAAVGTMAGDDAGDIARGALIGAGTATALPYLGRVIESERIHQGLTGALLGAGAGAMLGDSPEDIAVGALAGSGLMVLPKNVRKRIYDQAGIAGLDNLMRGVGHAMVRTNYTAIGRDQEILVGFHRGMRRRLLNAPEELAQWEMDVSSLGVIGALAKRQGGDENLAAATISFGYVSAAVDWIASAQAGVVSGVVGQNDAFRMARNKIINQLRPIDLGRPAEDVVGDVAKALAWTERGGAGGSLAQVRKRQQELVEQLILDPDRAVKLAEEHNNQIGDTINQLFDQRNFPKVDTDFSMPAAQRNTFGDEWATVPMRTRGDIFSDHSARYFESIGDFGKFTAVANDIRLGRLGGLFDPAVLKPVTNRRGRLVSPLARELKVDPEAARVNKAINDLLVGNRIDMSKLGSARLTPLAGAHEAGRFTMMRIDEATKQDLETWAEQVADIVDTWKILTDQKSRNWLATIDLHAIDEAIGSGALTNRQIVTMAKQAAAKGANRKATRKLIAFAGHHKITLGRLDGELSRMADGLAQADDWERLGFARQIFDERGQELGGFDALQRRLKQLRERIPYTAAEVDLDDLERYYAGLDRTPVSFTMRPNFTDDEWARAAADFADLPDSAIITVYHGTTDANAAAILAAKKVDPTPETSMMGGHADHPEAMYVTVQYETARQFGPKVLEIRVRKGDIFPSDEALRHFSPDEATFSGLMADDFGSIIRGDIDVRPATRPKNGLPEYQRRTPVDTDKLTELRQLRAGLESRGYKLVHGTEFLMPEDLAFNVPTFNDITRRHLNAVTMGNFFGRRHPVEAQIVEDRRRRLAIVDELSQVGHDVPPDDAKVDNILSVLERWLRAEQDDIGKRMSEAHLQNVVRRTADRITSSFTPIRLDDIGGFSKPDKVLKALRDAGIDEDQAMAVIRAMRKFRNSDFADVGLYSLEAKLRQKSVPASFLKMLGGTRYGTTVTGRAAGQAATGAAVGAVAGIASADKDASFEEKLKRALGGGVVGGAIGAGAAAGITKLDDATNVIQRVSDWRYGYLADGYARLRDSLRFTLSPWFDLSRYTEGLMLAQTGAPLRKADGTRLSMPGNASPSRLRHKLAKKLEQAGHSPASAKAAARQQYESVVSEFNAVARNRKDFDADAIDSAGHWFRQVGVLGFSPTDWMATAFAHLRTEGLGLDEAYEAARSMYNYGTRGRSAAEMSVNFIFFPFSFQKKALTHMGKWLNDDLGRSIILHDALKTYEALDERYNLDEFWKDHVPFLQQLQRLNLFAYGISPGRFGGINSQLFEGVGKLAWNMFIPVGANIRDVSAGEELQSIGKQMVPLWNDINWMMHDMQEVAFPVIAGATTPMAAVSFDAQVRKGYDEWYSFKTDFETALQEKGYTTTDVFAKPWLTDQLEMYQRKQAELAEKYPAWFASRQEVPGNVIAIDMEKKMRIRAVEFGVGSPDDEQVAEMQQFIDDAKRQVELVTGSSNLDNAPPQVFDAILNKAAEFARTNPDFVGLWNKFWRYEFGMIDIALEMQ